VSSNIDSTLIQKKSQITIFIEDHYLVSSNIDSTLIQKKSQIYYSFL